MDILKKTQQDYNLIAEHFSRTRQFIWPDLKPFLKLVKPGDRVLDAGCGNGRLYNELKNKKIDYLGLDFSQELLAIAQQQHPQAKFKLGDLTEAKTWSGIKNFDFCFCIAVLHHLPTTELQLKMLKFIYHALKKDSQLVLAVWNLWRPGLKEPRLEIPYQASPDLIVNRFYYAFTLGELKNLVKKAGFKVSRASIGRNLYILAKKC